MAWGLRYLDVYLVICNQCIEFVDIFSSGFVMIVHGHAGLLGFVLQFFLVNDR